MTPFVATLGTELVLVLAFVPVGNANDVDFAVVVLEDGRLSEARIDSLAVVYRNPDWPSLEDNAAAFAIGTDERARIAERRESRP